MMVETRIALSGFWIALMLIYLLGDVLRIFAGDFEPGKMAGKQATQRMWFVAALVMLIPILMIILTLTIYHPSIRWISIVMSVFLVIFNILGLPYPGFYDNFLIIVSFVVNALIIWFAWTWKPGLV